MKLGIMGGTFDPIHIGHLILGECAAEQFSLDKVLYIPAGNPPHKLQREGRATNEQRAEMVRLAIGGNPRFELSLREMQSAEYSFTYKTLEAMREERPEDELFFIIGGDSLHDFPLWRNPQRICNACTLLAATRNHVEQTVYLQEIELLRTKFNASIEALTVDNLDVSSQMLRERIAGGQSVRYYVPDAVREYIDKHSIYKG
ncbi:MAG: nicotinate-nucleotide adenylyltransferase [Lachnospiraceae bacterium]|nr:nicotinate-nucleotide adenylyltransferase [Lachnospiraceae bacterium]